MEKRFLKNTKSIKLSSSSSSASLSSASSQLVLSKRKSLQINQNRFAKSPSRAYNSRHEQCHMTKTTDDLKLHTRRYDCSEKSANDSSSGPSKSMDRCNGKYLSKIKSEPCLHVSSKNVRLKMLPKTDLLSSKTTSAETKEETTKGVVTKKSNLNGKKKEMIGVDWEVQIKRRKIKSRSANQEKNEKPLHTVSSRRVQITSNKICNGKKLRNGKPSEDSTIQLKTKKFQQSRNIDMSSRKEIERLRNPNVGKSQAIFQDIQNIISDMLLSKKIFTTVSIFERKQMLERNNHCSRSPGSPKPFNVYLDFKKPVSNSIFKDQENASIPLNFYPFNLRLFKTEKSIVPTKKIKDDTNKSKQSCSSSSGRHNNIKLSTKGPFYLKQKSTVVHKIEDEKIKTKQQSVKDIQQHFKKLEKNDKLSRLTRNNFTEKKIIRDVEFEKKLNEIYARGRSDDSRNVSGQYEIVVDKIDDRSKNDKQLYVRCHSMVSPNDPSEKNLKKSMTEMENNVTLTRTELEKKQMSLMIGKEILDKIGPRRASISAPSRISKHFSMIKSSNSKSISFPCSLENDNNNFVHKKIEFFENIKRCRSNCNDEGLTTAKNANKQIKLTRFSMSQSSADFKELFGETQLANYKISNHTAASSEYGNRFGATSQLFHLAKDENSDRIQNTQEQSESSYRYVEPSHKCGIFPRDNYLRSVEIGHVKRLKIKFESMEELDRDRNNSSLCVPRKFTSDSQLTRNLVRNFEINDNKAQKFSCKSLKKKFTCKCKSQSLGFNSQTLLNRETSSIPHINYIKKSPQLNEFFASKGFIVDPRVKGIETCKPNIKEKLSLSSPELNRMRNQYDDSPWIFCRHFQDFRTTSD